MPILLILGHRVWSPCPLDLYPYLAKLLLYSIGHGCQIQIPCVDCLAKEEEGRMPAKGSLLIRDEITMCPTCSAANPPVALRP
jgi:hypothetical protein